MYCKTKYSCNFLLIKNNNYFYHAKWSLHFNYNGGNIQHSIRKMVYWVVNLYPMKPFTHHINLSHSRSKYSIPKLLPSPIACMSVVKVSSKFETPLMALSNTAMDSLIRPQNTWNMEQRQKYTHTPSFMRLSGHDFFSHGQHDQQGFNQKKKMFIGTFSPHFLIETF